MEMDLWHETTQKSTIAHTNIESRRTAMDTRPSGLLVRTRYEDVSRPKKAGNILLI